ncbi:MAG TPA: N-acetylmuramoyl-L-alanine amidase [Candidatus Acidoferrales bacterium]|nr:N-acetylmuramoyl-L-alanine amidase [Candidatus Acidoferrales bacterium]
MRTFCSFVIFVIALALLNLRPEKRAFAETTAQEQTQQTGQQPPPATSQPAPPQQAPPLAPAAPVHVGPVVVLDPGHGGTDSGARGGTGAIEKDIVLQYAHVVRSELEREGFRVVLTRDDDSNPSYDDRAAMANTYHDVVFVSLHISTTGTVGTARAYYYRFASAPAGPPAISETTTAPNAPPAASLLVWEQAQQPYVEGSRRLADALQGELAQRFAGSPITTSGVAIRELRSVAAPAVAVELSSVSVADPNSLSAMAAPLAAAIARGLQVFRSTGSTPEN